MEIKQFKEQLENYEDLFTEQKENIRKILNNPELMSKFSYILEDLLWIKRPPTPEEFLNPNQGYLPVEMIDSLYPFVRENFIQAMRTNNPYKYIVNYGSTRLGKSLMSHLYIIYSIIYINYMKYPHLYYGLNPLSNICIYLVSFKKDKTRELILGPLRNILYASKVFKNLKFEDQVRQKGVTEDGIIHFSEACGIVTTGGLTFPKLLIICGSRVGDLIGANIISAVVSEINHFKEAAHISDEDVLNIYSKLDSRITGTIVRDRFPCYLYLDSSANNAESPIEKLVQLDLKKNKNCFYNYYRRWEVLPEKFPIWAKANKLKGENIDIYYSHTWKKPWTTDIRNKKTFKVCIGDGSYPAFIVKEEKQLEDIPKHLIKNFPIDSYDSLNVKLIESIRDIGGFASTSEAKVVQDVKLINNIFKNELENIEGEIVVGASSIPERLIWNQIYKKFFIQVGDNRYQIKRALREPRFIGVDSASSSKGCLMSVVVGHFESYKGIKKFISDFTLAIAPDDTGINLEALQQFLLDLKRLGRLQISEICMDIYQSVQTWQNLERANFNVTRLSVETVVPYQFLMTQLYANNVYCGKNIYVKNNLNSLYRQKDKKGREIVGKSDGTSVHKYNYNWELSVAGIHEKDVSDSLCRAVYVAFNNYKIMPVTDYEQENIRLGVSPITRDIKKTREVLVRRLLGSNIPKKM